MEKSVNINIKIGEKIFIGSDPHGNATLFIKGIEEAIAQGAEKFIILGDLLTDFQETRELLDYLQNLEKRFPNAVFNFKGNRDIDMIKRFDGDNQQWTPESPSATLLFSYQDMDENDINWMKKFYDYGFLDIEDADYSVYLSHEPKLNDERRKAYEDKKNVTTFVNGHSHRYWDVEVVEDTRTKRTIRYINPGSLGLTEDSIAYGGTYILATVRKEGLGIEPMVIIADENDKEKLLSEINNNERLKPSNWDDLLRLSLKTGRNATTTYFKEIRRLLPIKAKILEIQEIISNTNDQKIIDKLTRELNELNDILNKPLSLYEGIMNGFININVDKDGNPLELCQTYSSFTQKEEIPVDYINDENVNSIPYGLLQYPTVVEELTRIAINNTLFYSTAVQKNGIGPEFKLNGISYR